MSWNKMLWKAAPVKKKRQVKFKNVLISQVLGTQHDTIQNEYRQWKKDCESTTKADLGITGRGHKKDGTIEDPSLLGHVMNHINAKVQRPAADSKTGANISLPVLENIILHDDLIEDDDEDTLRQFIKDISALSNTDSDPKNIRFTIPTGVDKKGDKKVDVGAQPTYGHYRTPDYVVSRKEVHNSEGEIEAVPEHWYSHTPNSNNSPPFHQAIFANSSVSKKQGKEISKGLLGIMERFAKAIDDGYLEDITIEDTGDLQGRVESLSNLKVLIDKLEEILSNQNSYRGTGRILKYIGVGGIMTQLRDMSFKSDTTTSSYLASLGDIKNITGSDDIKNFKIYFTEATVNRLINGTIRAERKKFLAPNGKPYQLSSAGDGQKTKGQSWTPDYERAVAESMPKTKKIEKSWIDNLWN